MTLLDYPNDHAPDLKVIILINADGFVVLVCRAQFNIAILLVLEVEMTDECKSDIISAREELINAETALLSSHRSILLQQIRSQYEELRSFIKSAQGVFLSTKVFWWWACISYATSLYSLWGLMQLFLQWWKS